MQGITRDLLVSFEIFTFNLITGEISDKFYRTQKYRIRHLVLEPHERIMGRIIILAVFLLDVESIGIRIGFRDGFDLNPFRPNGYIITRIVGFVG